MEKINKEEIFEKVYTNLIKQKKCPLCQQPIKHIKDDVYFCKPCEKVWDEKLRGSEFLKTFLLGLKKACQN